MQTGPNFPFSFFFQSQFYVITSMVVWPINICILNIYYDEATLIIYII